MNPLRSLILAAAGSDAIRRVVTASPGTRGVVERFIAGETVADAVTTVGRLVDDGLYVSLDHLGENTTGARQAERAVQAYLELLDRLHTEGLSTRTEVSLKLSAVGLRLDEKLALDNAWRICAAAEQNATTVTLDMEEHDTVEATLRVLAELRHTWPWVGAVLQSYLKRTQGDAAALAAPDSRVRLCKGAYAATSDVAHRSGHHVDLSYVRAANTLLAGDGYPMFATHDPRLITLLHERVRWYGRKQGSYEYQMLYGVRPDEQRRLAAEGETVRVYVPFGANSYGYLMRRLAERPANLAFFLRALVSRS
ncbi:proline dehydrogenase family protein [Amycolatopsis acidiphila]|uniref:proline dehydrogenase n=1 Tax=Amycolatopsis acidiphila TaxID=715473 RepID=A0A558A002_9PSEU|nr:proline dehydrogenase family protein [Amycolatopsis acidiphila]TVT17595.1 proline dehydrogenase [Amycolatopsis acidiphila]UIJ60497.1 proline dehydrogenase family protein [Amycolatopsis acidiphila]GHG82539.1 proline dehydrogenase [Amycolatopsis acidiphila]